MAAVVASESNVDVGPMTGTPEVQRTERIEGERGGRRSRRGGRRRRGRSEGGGGESYGGAPPVAGPMDNGFDEGNRETTDAFEASAGDIAPAAARSFDTPRDLEPGNRFADSPRPPEPAREPEMRSFDFEPGAPAHVQPREPSPPVVHEPTPVATASEPREWTPTPPTDTTTPRSEP